MSVMREKRVYLFNQGCRKNLLFGELYKEYFTENGLEVTENYQQADIILLNTCAFTKNSEDFAMRRIKKVQREKKTNSFLIIGGCLPSISQQTLKQVFCGPTFSQKEYLNLGDIVKLSKKKLEEIKFPNQLEYPTFWGKVKQSHFSPETLLSVRLIRKMLHYAKQYLLRLEHEYDEFHTSETWQIRVSDGCLSSCSFCAIPKAVGRLKSRPPEDVVKDFETGLKKGHKKFALLSDDLGAYGKDLKLDFGDLLRTLVKTNGDYKISVTNINAYWFVRLFPKLRPSILTEKVSDLTIPVQSGNNRILRLMMRTHSIEDFITRVETLRREIPHIKINTQVMVGFPSESEREFRDTYNMLKKLKFYQVDVFKYTDRPHTLSSLMGEKIPEQIKDKRYRKIRRLLIRQRIARVLG